MKIPKGSKLDVERIVINRQGYDSHGRYWGVGQKLYRVTDSGGFVNKYIRAKDAKTARLMVLFSGTTY